MFSHVIASRAMPFFSFLEAFVVITSARNAMKEARHVAKAR